MDFADTLESSPSLLGSFDYWVRFAREDSAVARRWRSFIHAWLGEVE